MSFSHRYPSIAASRWLVLLVGLRYGRPVFAALGRRRQSSGEPAGAGRARLAVDRLARPRESRRLSPTAEASRTVYFASSDATIDSEGSEVLRQNAQKLKEDSTLLVVLVGHTDNLGSAAYNLAVADRRTEAVSERLRSLGVPRNQIRRLPVGSEESSKQKCDSETCRRLMRRVELVYERR
jgi:outer membrane protein OmpA-like peptidoglycan-associated protein